MATVRERKLGLADRTSHWSTLIHSSRTRYHEAFPLLLSFTLTSSFQLSYDDAATTRNGHTRVTIVYFSKVEAPHWPKVNTSSIPSQLQSLLLFDKKNQGHHSQTQPILATVTELCFPLRTDCKALSSLETMGRQEAHCCSRSC